MSSQAKTPEDLEFEAKLAKAFYKTTAKSIGTMEPKRKSLLNQSPTTRAMESMANSRT